MAAAKVAPGSLERSDPFPKAQPAAYLIPHWFASTPEEMGANEGGRHVPND